MVRLGSSVQQCKTKYPVPISENPNSTLRPHHTHPPLIPHQLVRTHTRTAPRGARLWIGSVHSTQKTYVTKRMDIASRKKNAKKNGEIATQYYISGVRSTREVLGEKKTDANRVRPILYQGEQNTMACTTDDWIEQKRKRRKREKRREDEGRGKGDCKRVTLN
ncbi:hypothetical protein AG1IA_05909 [Rhizoctonia solani AG-1 IA]|uniref:Uncharacterized protein n=1 Tax=Thanatephorus cucumeris (strain AG1-IA) TaxID=983506 RepID=L8WPJ0_THACA|nr:hypothetical protein AG1IA_05909 [Rhizoctonia solani AG-1 IA]